MRVMVVISMAMVGQILLAAPTAFGQSLRDGPCLCEADWSEGPGWASSSPRGLLTEAAHGPRYTDRLGTHYLRPYDYHRQFDYPWHRRVRPYCPQLYPRRAAALTAPPTEYPPPIEYEPAPTLNPELELIPAPRSAGSKPAARRAASNLKIFY